MDWQSIAAAGLASMCGIWLLKGFIRPFLPGRVGGCGGCGAGRRGVEARPDALLEILPPGEGDWVKNKNVTET